jgi:U3 small nucleolar RNA-associated protein MPP10
MKPSGRVRFHDEVQVRKIRAKGKNLPLSTMDEDDNEDDGDDNDDEFGEDVDMEDFMKTGLDVGDDDENESNDEDGNEMDEDDEENQGRQTIERLKGDLFAEDETSLHQGGLHSSRLSQVLTTN